MGSVSLIWSYKQGFVYTFIFSIVFEHSNCYNNKDNIIEEEVDLQEMINI